MRSIESLVVDALNDAECVASLKPNPPKQLGVSIHASTLFADCPARALIEAHDASRYTEFDEGIAAIGVFYQGVVVAALRRWVYGHVADERPVPWECGNAHVDALAWQRTARGVELGWPESAMLEIKTASKDDRAAAPSRAVAQAQGYQWLAARAGMSLAAPAVIVVHKIYARTTLYPVPPATPAFHAECERRLATLLSLEKRIATLDFWLDDELRAFCRCSQCFWEPPVDATHEVAAICRVLAPVDGRELPKAAQDVHRAKLKQLVPAGHRGYQGVANGLAYTVKHSAAGALRVAFAKPDVEPVR